MPAEALFCADGTTPKQAEAIQNINAAIERLARRRRARIEVVGPLAKSKLAWKVATFQQAILYRIVMLAWGAAAANNASNMLASFLSARALVETVAHVTDFEKCIAALIQAGDLDGINDLVTNRIFSSRDPEWLADQPDTRSVNILTHIDKFDKAVPGFRRHYDSLSERCHPNSLGHHQMFSTIDTSTGAVDFSDSKNRSRNLDHLIAAVFLVCLVESTMGKLDQVVLDLADLQDRGNSV